MAEVSYCVSRADAGNGALGRLLVEQTMVDVALVCGPDSIRVHRMVLALNSSYFMERFRAEPRANLVVFEDGFSVLLSLVQFMYYGRTCFGGREASRFLAAARFLQVRGLEGLVLEDQPLDHQQMPAFRAPVFLVELDDVDPNPIVEFKKEANPASTIQKDIVSVQADHFDEDAASFKKRGRPKKNSFKTRLHRTTRRSFIREVENSIRTLDRLKSIDVDIDSTHWSADTIQGVVKEDILFVDDGSSEVVTVDRRGHDGGAEESPIILQYPYAGGSDQVIEYKIVESLSDAISVPDHVAETLEGILGIECMHYE